MLRSPPFSKVAFAFSRRFERTYASEAHSALSKSLAVLAPRRRGKLAGRDEVAGAFSETSKLTSEHLKQHFDLRQLCALCRCLSAGGYIPSEQLLQAASAKVDAALNERSLLRNDAEAAAELALAACEAGNENKLGTGLVQALCSANITSTGDDEGLGATGAASLALAAASVGLADTTLLDSLVARCSAFEMDLDLAALGDLRLAASLAGPATVANLDVRASGFLRTLCSDALLDDPRSTPDEDKEPKELLTELELEISETLHACETPHSQAAMICGGFFPLVSHGRGGVICAENVAAYATYANAPEKRTAWQQWKYRVAAAAGLKVFVVPEVEWRARVGGEERAAFLQQVLQQPFEVSAS